jgi:3-oxoacyl-[acyl-carrier protein] reductase
MTESGLAGRVALVTGGSRGIGRAVVLGLARAGAHVAVNYGGAAAAAAEVRDSALAEGVRAVTAGADVSDPAAVQAMVRQVENDLGPIDLLVTSAGIVRHEDRDAGEFDTWRRIMAVNVDGTYLPVMAVKDAMIARGYGRIVTISSIAGLAPRPQMIPYATSKAAVVAFTRNCAKAFGPAVRINSVAPGLIETDMTADVGPETRQRMIDEAALGRVGAPDDIAEAVLFLLSDASGFITGQTLVADGGRIMLP